MCVFLRNYYKLHNVAYIYVVNGRLYVAFIDAVESVSKGVITPVTCNSDGCQSTM